MGELIAIPVLLVLQYHLLLAYSQNLVRVELMDGSPVVGTSVYGANGKPVNEFLGIPFAEPPVDDLRFRPPVRKKPWQEERLCNIPPNSCMQTPDTYFGQFKGSTMWNPNTPVSEDCLYLNVWSPVKWLSHGQRVGELLPVMVWIYGGGFWSGTATLDVYDGKILASEENVIIVSMNYRVSVFGFFYLGREEAPGNVGLLDQLMALQWVRDNIVQFGGDPDQVTLFGESAGAASVGMHILSPMSKNFFKRAIMQSGSPTASWATSPRHVAIFRALQLSESCDCNVTKHDADPDLRKVAECLRGKTADYLLSKEWITYEFCDFPWVPVVDSHFLVETPEMSVRHGRFNPVDILTGSNLDESMYFIIYHLPNIFESDQIFTKKDFILNYTTFATSARALLPKHMVKNPILFDAVMHEYANWDLPSSAAGWQDSTDKMMGDYLFTCPVNQFTESHRTFAQMIKGPKFSTYMYYFQHRSNQLPWPEWMGVLHGYEIPYIFGEPLDAALGYTESEKELSRQMMNYWANFAREGNPNVGLEGQHPLNVWPVHSAERKEFIHLSIGKESGAIGNGIRPQQCSFWLEYLPKLMVATEDFHQLETSWKQEYDKWMNEYLNDWKYLFQRYTQRQDKFSSDKSCSG